MVVDSMSWKDIAERFSQFLSYTTLNSLQEEYIKSIITYVCDNGDITTSTLIEEEPFAQYEWIDTFGQNFVAVRNYVNELHNIVKDISALFAKCEVIMIEQSDVSVNNYNNKMKHECT